MAEAIGRGEVRLYRFPPPDKQRPVVVLTRDSAISYLSAVTVAPITSTIRGVPSEVLLTERDGMKDTCAINLHNVVTVSKTHLGRRVATLSSERLREMLRGAGLRPRLCVTRKAWIQKPGWEDRPLCSRLLFTISATGRGWKWTSL